MKHALITGIVGQDGAYLAKLLLDKGYKVYGFMKPRTSKENLYKLNLTGHPRLSLIDGDLTDASSVNSAVMMSQPDEIYNLAAQSHVGYSFKVPQQTCSVNYMGYLNILFAARKYAKQAKIYQAGTSEMFGYSAYGLERQSEETCFKPMSPYAISKVASHWAGINSRYESDQFVSNGILFNHESPLREIGFVTRKITNAVATNQPLRLGNIDSKRDWGFAGDYVEAMWRMLQHDRPDDFVVATGITHTVREFVTAAYAAIGKEIKYDGDGINEIGIIDGEIKMTIDKEFYRPNDLSYLCGDASKIKNVLEWETTMRFEQLVETMVLGDMK